MTNLQNKLSQYETYEDFKNECWLDAAEEIKNENPSYKRIEEYMEELWEEHCGKYQK